MAYGFNSGFNAPYSWQNYTQNTPVYPVQMPARPAYQRPVVQSEITRVNGEAGARNIRLQPNGGALRLDETAPILWVIQADGAGYTTATPFTITQYQQAPAIDLNSLESRVKKLEDIFNEQPSVEPVKRKGKRTERDE